MITRWKLRLAATAVTLATVVHPAASHAEPTMIANRPATTHMDHISVEAVGAGSPVILVPGLSSPRAVWDGVTPTLARTHRVYLIQINGFAGEAPGANLGPGMLDGVVADIDALIVRQRMSKPALVGHSLGGLVGLMIARAHPDHIGRLMIVDALPFVGALFGPTATVEMVRPQAAAMRDMMARTQEDAAARSANAEKVASQMTLTPRRPRQGRYLGHRRRSPRRKRGDVRGSDHRHAPGDGDLYDADHARLSMERRAAQGDGGSTVQARICRCAFRRLRGCTGRRAFRDARSAGRVPRRAHDVSRKVIGPTGLRQAKPIRSASQLEVTTPFFRRLVGFRAQGARTRYRRAPDEAQGRAHRGTARARATG